MIWSFIFSSASLRTLTRLVQHRSRSKKTTSYLRVINCLKLPTLSTGSGGCCLRGWHHYIAATDNYFHYQIKLPWPHSKEALRSNVPGLQVLPVPACVSSSFMHVGLIGNSNLPVGVIVSVISCLSLSVIGMRLMVSQLTTVKFPVVTINHFKWSLLLKLCLIVMLWKTHCEGHSTMVLVLPVELIG